MSDIPVLTCTDGSLRGSVYAVPEDRGLRIGRADDNDVVIAEEGVSRFHAELIYQNGSLWLQDAGSRNGVFVNSNRVVGHQALKVGDEITIADHRFAVRWPDSGGTQASAAGSEGGKAQPGPSEGQTVGKGKAIGKRKWFWPFS
jgi:pSer/pThr/pTyr-binding forkhead associated (FHA) protein